MVRGFDHCLQFLAGVEGHYAARGDRNLLAGLGIASGTLRLLAQLEIAEPRKLDAVARLERGANFLEEALNHVLRFALVESELFEQQICEFGFGERHRHPPDPRLGADFGRAVWWLKTYFRSDPPNRSSTTRKSCPTTASISASVKVRAVSCISTRIARLFLFWSTPGPR